MIKHDTVNAGSCQPQDSSSSQAAEPLAPAAAALPPGADAGWRLLAPPPGRDVPGAMGWQPGPGQGQEQGSGTLALRPAGHHAPFRAAPADGPGITAPSSPVAEAGADGALADPIFPGADAAPVSASFLAPHGEVTLLSGSEPAPSASEPAAGNGAGASAATTVSTSGNASIDALLGGTKWTGGSVTYSFPASATDYAVFGSGDDEQNTGFSALSAQQANDMRAILEGTASSGAMSYGSYESFTNIDFIELTASPGAASIRVAISSLANPTAYAYYPGTSVGSGDIWLGATYFGTGGTEANPLAGSYGYLTLLHEAGHALGLKHPHENFSATSPTAPTLPADVDSLEFTVMSYRSYVGADLGGYTNEQFGYPTTPMMLDIQALQHLYGADYTVNSTDTTYSWNPATGEMSLNGVGQGAPGGNRIFLTVWDGGGRDAYDMSNYTNGVSVDLRPGKWSVNSQTQLADLGDGFYSRGTVFNALLYNNDTASLIEDAIGGLGNDTLMGNQVSNLLAGGAGIDLVSFADAASVSINLGSSGNAEATTSQGTDTLSGVENIIGTSGNDSIAGNMAVDESFSGGAGDDTLIAAGAGNNSLDGGADNDVLSGGAGNDTLVGGAGDDSLLGSGGNDWVIFGGAAGVTVALDAMGNAVATGEGTDTLGGIENLRSAGGNDSLAGNGQANVLDAGAGNDTLTGGAGTDTLLGGDAADLLYGSDSIGAGSDGDYLDGSTGDDTVLGADGNDTILAGAGNDSIAAGGGDDSINGGAGNDTIIGGAGADWAIYSGASGAVTVNLDATGTGTVAGADGADTLNGIENIVGGNSADRITVSGSFGVNIDGGAGSDTIVTGAGNDTIFGGANNDTINAGGGDDVIAGGGGSSTISPGSNSLNGGTGTDWVTYATVGNILGITATLDNVGAGTATGGANDRLAGIENLRGSGLGDRFTGSGPDNVFDGGGGNDTLTGGGGNDTLLGADGNDRIFGSDILGSGTDANSLDGGLGDDTILGAGGNDTILGGDGTDSIDAGAGDDLVLWRNGDGSDSLRGGTGTDTLLLDGWGGSYGISTDSIANGTYGSWVVSGSAANRIFVNGSSTIHATGFEGIACFARGTLIATARGEVAVEELRLGDLVVTGGRGAGLRPVAWIGRTRAVVARHPDRAAIAPILVRAGALGAGVPHRDLRVSPEHALFLDGMLVPAGLLVNGTTILQELWCPSVEYWHVELPAHGLLLAEGALAESYLDDGNRAQFDNGPVAALFPNFARERANGIYDRSACHPVLRHGERLEALRARLAAVERPSGPAGRCMAAGALR